MASPAALPLEWREEPDDPPGHVNKGALAWCGCGWRSFHADPRGVDGAEAALERHRATDCPRRMGATG